MSENNIIDLRPLLQYNVIPQFEQFKSHDISQNDNK